MNEPRHNGRHARPEADEPTSEAVTTTDAIRPVAGQALRASSIESTARRRHGASGASAAVVGSPAHPHPVGPYRPDRQQRQVPVHRSSPPEVPRAAAPPAPLPPPQASTSRPKSTGLFGVRRRLRDLEGENHALAARASWLQAELDRFGQHSAQQVHALNSRIANLNAELDVLRNKDAAQIERETEAAARRLGMVRSDLAAATDALHHERNCTQALAADNDATVIAARAEADRILATAQQRAEDSARAAVAEARDRMQTLEQTIADRGAHLQQIDGRIVTTEDLAMLQEAGIYEFRHRLADAVAYKARLESLRDTIKTMVRSDTAVLAATGWTVNGSERDGRKMVADFSKLMLRAYNAEADNGIRTMKPHRLASSVDRLVKARETIARLGRTMDIRISDGYHRARVDELELTADHLAKQEEEKDRIRAERERQRDEDAARKEFEREKARLSKEQAHWQRAHDKWEDQGDEAKVAEAQAKLDQLDAAIAGVEAQEANIRTGWVYVISNVGAFGENMVKVGLTRRLDPKERVRELGDASVPFKFDVHALVFSSDAVGLENRLHRELADRRVNRVNLRREFFHATPAEVLAALQRTEARDNLLEYTEFAEAEEWRTSLKITEQMAA